MTQRRTKWETKEFTATIPRHKEEVAENCAGFAGSASRIITKMSLLLKGKLGGPLMSKPEYEMQL